MQRLGIDVIRVLQLDSMQDTPFSVSYGAKVAEYFSERGITVTDSAWKCDLLVTRFFPWRTRQLKIGLRYGLHRPILVWTDEPRFDTHFQREISSSPLLRKVHIMNAHTGDIYLTNFSVFGWAIAEPLAAVIEPILLPRGTRRTIFLATYVEDVAKRALIREGRDINLFGIRQDLALKGYNQGLVDIYGQGWPNNIAREASRGEGWHERKLQLMSKYSFNICLENTNIPYYCTEKIWDSIRSRCLPIYFGGGNRIYEDFPRESFVDYANFESPEELIDYLERMTPEEHMTRLNRCIEVYNNKCDPAEKWRQTTMMLDKIIERVRSIVS